MNVVCLCVLSLVLVAIANLTTVELKSCLICLHKKPADHLSGLCYFFTSGELCTCHLYFLLNNGLTSFARSPRQCCSRQLCWDTVFVFAVFLFLPFSFFAFFVFAFRGSVHRITFPLLLLTFVMASSQMHCRWTQQLHSPKHVWIMAVSAFSVTDVDLTNLIIACSIPWPILVNGVPEVFRNQVLITGTLEVRIPSLTSSFVLFDV